MSQGHPHSAVAVALEPHKRIHGCGRENAGSSPGHRDSGTFRCYHCIPQSWVGDISRSEPHDTVACPHAEDADKPHLLISPLRDAAQPV